MTEISLVDIQNYLPEKIDYFFFSASFEERCYSIIKNIEKSRIDAAFMCINEDQINTFQGNDIILFEHISKVKNHKRVSLDSEHPVKTTKTLIDLFSQLIVDNKVIAVDITTFTHETLLIVFRLIILKGFSLEKVWFLYNNAECYSFNEVEIEKKWLSIGNKEMRTVFGYSGFMSPLKPNALIVLVGFESERTKKLIDTYEPSKVVLGVGNDHCTDDASAIELNRFQHRQLLKDYYDSEIFEFSVQCPYESKNVLKIECAKYADFNIVIAPMNNKITTLGVAMLAIENSDIQICYVPAKYYNIEGYSKPGKKCFLFNLAD